MCTLVTEKLTKAHQKAATEDGHQDLVALDKKQKGDRWALSYINVTGFFPP